MIICGNDKFCYLSTLGWVDFKHFYLRPKRELVHDFYGAPRKGLEDYNQELLAVSNILFLALKITKNTPFLIFFYNSPTFRGFFES